MLNSPTTHSCGLLRGAVPLLHRAQSTLPCACFLCLCVFVECVVCVCVCVVCVCVCVGCDLSDEPVVWAVSTLSAREDVAVGTVVGTLAASDPEGARPQYTQQVGLVPVCMHPSEMIMMPVCMHPSEMIMMPVRVLSSGTADACFSTHACRGCTCLFASMPAGCWRPHAD
jgi:hypothetical protein